MSRVSGNRRGRPRGVNFPCNLHVSITKAQREKLERVATCRDLPFAHLVRRLIDDLVDEQVGS